MARSQPPDGDARGPRRLDSWKEIAAYLHRDVRTARRWERREGLPVHRHHHAVLGSVYAFEDEIEAWRTQRRSVGEAAPIRRVPVPLLVGRTREITQLHAALGRARCGDRQVVFVCGAMGVGKTALVQTFLASVREVACVGEGECVEQFGPFEPYLPFTEALVRLAAGEHGRAVIDAIERYAPSWAHVVVRRSRKRSAPTTARESGPPRPGELCRLFEALAAGRPVILTIENMHVIDAASLDLLARLAGRREYAQLMVVGTYRTESVGRSQRQLSRLSHDLRAHFRCTDMQVPTLDEAAVSDYLEAQGTWTDLRAAARWFHERSAGNPLFLMHLMEHLTNLGAIQKKNGCWLFDEATVATSDTVPDTLRGLMQSQLAMLDDTARSLLEVASVTGDAFSAAVVAAAARTSLFDAERVLQRLAQENAYIQCDGATQGPDGTLCSRYRFAHHLSRQIVCEQIPVATRLRIRRQVEDTVNAG